MSKNKKEQKKQIKLNEFETPKDYSSDTENHDENDSSQPLELNTLDDEIENELENRKQPEDSSDENEYDDSSINFSGDDITIEEEEYKPSKTSAVFAILMGIVIILAGWAVYNYFDTSDTGDIGEQGETASLEIESEEVEISLENDYEGFETDEAAENTADSLEIAVPIVEVAPETGTSAPDTGLTPELISTSPADTEFTGWTANNYNAGDITGDTQTVVSGDTLWEIAEGAYGNGADWQKIADANNVSYLSNGNPLIHPGQVLVLP